MKSLYLSLFILGIAFASVNNEYTAHEITTSTKDGAHITHTSITYNGQDSYYIKPISKIAQSLDISVTSDSSTEFTVVINDTSKAQRFALPHGYPFSYTKVNFDDKNLDYKVSIEQNPFSFAVTRVSTNETIFNTTAFDFTFSDFYLSFGTQLPSQYLYGLGERARDFLYQTGTYTIWNRDQGNQMDNGVGGAQQTYGTHPVYLMREQSGKWHMVYLRTTNALEFNFNSTEPSLQFMLTGGIIELKFFMGDENPDTAIKMYHNYINGWMIQPFWSHGYHQCRWGYENLTALLDVISNMTYNSLPLDVIWSDIDYMSNFTDFTVDSNRYNLTQFKELAQTTHFIPIVDAGVAINKSAISYIQGEANNVWIRSALDNGHPLTGVVWPGMVHYPDWYNPNTSIYWEQMVALLYDILPVSGIWLDMNENSNFCVGEYPNQCDFLDNYLPDAGSNPNTSSYSNGDESDNPFPYGPIDPWIVSFNSSQLPYLPGNALLELHAMSVNALHYGGILEFDVHNLNGFFESMYTNAGLQSISGKRPFLLSRSTHVGSGQFTAHWTGDNDATWDFLRVSIPTLFNFQLYGIPMVGADICGFNDDTTVELCARWMQLGAFYPFMRNHNTIGAISQEPYALGPIVLEASRASLLLRYSILKFYYSLFVKNNGLGTVFRPVFFDFHNDETLLSLDSQFLIGSELMVASVGYEGLTQVGVYFPAGASWYDFFTGALIANQQSQGTNITVDAPLNGTLPVFIKGGSIVHTQNVDGVLNTTGLDNVFNLVVALNQDNQGNYEAYGGMLGIANYLDDDTVDECIGQNDCLIVLNVTGQAQANELIIVELNVSRNTARTRLEDIFISNVTFYGVSQANKVVECTSESPIAVQFGSIQFQISSDFTCQTISRKHFDRIEN